jgi:hypothetical protein
MLCNPFNDPIQSPKISYPRLKFAQHPKCQAGDKSSNTWQTGDFKTQGEAESNISMKTCIESQTL